MWHSECLIVTDRHHPIGKRQTCAQQPEKRWQKARHPGYDGSMAKKRPKKRDGVPQFPRKSFHIEPDLLAALDRFIAAQPVPPDYSAVFRTALMEFLRAQGYWPPPTEGK